MRSQLAVLIFIAWFLLPSRVLSQEDQKRKVLEAVERHATASKATDMPMIMKTVDVPYYVGGKLIRERKKLRQMLKVEIERTIEASKFTYKVEKIQSYNVFRMQLSDKDELKLLDEALGNNGWVVTLKVTYPGNPNDLSPDGPYRRIVLVRIEKGAGKIVGVYVFTAS